MGSKSGGIICMRICSVRGKLVMVRGKLVIGYEVDMYERLASAVDGLLVIEDHV